jgi:hypothetical protein
MLTEGPPLVDEVICGIEIYRKLQIAIHAISCHANSMYKRHIAVLQKIIASEVNKHPLSFSHKGPSSAI